MVENVCEPLNLHYHFLSARMNSTDQETVIFYKKKSIKKIKQIKLKWNFLKRSEEKKVPLSNQQQQTNKQSSTTLFSNDFWRTMWHWKLE